MVNFRLLLCCGLALEVSISVLVAYQDRVRSIDLSGGYNAELSIILLDYFGTLWVQELTGMSTYWQYFPLVVRICPIPVQLLSGAALEFEQLAH